MRGNELTIIPHSVPSVSLLAVPYCWEKEEHKYYNIQWEVATLSVPVLEMENKVLQTKKLELVRLLRIWREIAKY